ncbi:conserved protein, unknown function [Plasmodium vivax]|uniref:Uncharacterized protein n=5 Tax=Plasmodium vivax TaxID=5855 RepID=A5K4E4_PLAVS|nr:hypothetical protein, conserved [Plasmodium vivax]KMZ80581.1 hypothetical protein PVIIG_04366 [Plasmodium vivax India VII]KMZ84113.1 hypothetical protein PVBG_02340 [Plasmodium vivax Brazil I]KMZ99665.1 hypothetical protein PVNG_03135 [Plasmodium vivax North Korean]EDL45522.1 hypothetical protein, conserved [Plasmodium vivax]CAG9476686.1 unnamed protein product [Plasmodium vivax]|eukprot:XP_001615249.1 hypothetical protein [Plasmodium vivax Sal-1]
MDAAKRKTHGGTHDGTHSGEDINPLANFPHPSYVKLLIIPDEELLNLVDTFIEAIFNEATYTKTLQKMNIKKKCIITNLLEAQQQFYKSNMKENPMFLYNISDEEVKNIFNKTNGEKIDFHLFHEARRIIQMVMDNFKTYENYERDLFDGKKLVTKKELENYIDRYLTENGITDNVKIEFKEDLISAVKILKKKKQYFLHLQSRKSVKEKMMLSLCNHEIGTHLLRMINHDRNNLDMYNFRSCSATEEGLAVINSMYPFRRNHLFLVFPAIKYLTVCLGNFYPFSKLFFFLNTFVKDVDTCFKMCARVKRGLKDTATPGSVYHDQLYFIGSYSILKWHKSINFQLLYSGNIGLRCLNSVSNYVDVKDNMLPFFLSDEEKVSTYLKFLSEVSYLNGITPASCSFIDNG